MLQTHELQRDPLTGCLLRPALDARMREELARVRRYGGMFALVVLDLDHFKSVNDAFGHQRGDRVLAEFAVRVNTLIRLSDLLFRYGGDEFVLLLPGVSRDQGAGMVRRLLDHLRRSAFNGDPPLMLTLSAGVSGCPEDGMDGELLFTIADRRHYQAKRAGRAGVVSSEQASPSQDRPEPPSRMIERDDVFQAAMRFLARLSYEKRGRFSLTGPIGAGFSRVLAELCSVAEMQGFAVLQIRGSAALKGRRYGAVSQALRSHPSLTPLPIGLPQLLDTLRQWMLREHRRGLLLLLDDITDIDRGTFELVQTILAAPELDHVGVIIAEPNAVMPATLDLYATLHERAALTPLSFVGLRTWLRYSLHWEPPDEIVAWFHTETGGLPGPFWRGISWLLDQQALRRQGDSWTLPHDYRDLAIGNHLGRDTQRPPSNLPRGLSEFLGRAEDVAALNRLVAENRVTLLCGPGGIGKTRLALQVGAECLETFRDGVFFVGLVHVQDAEQVPPVIAEALGLSFQGAQDLTSQLIANIRDRNLLLILDNLEQIRGIEALLYRLLDETTALHLLVTSRERPAIQEAVALELRGMDLPMGDDATALLGSSAAQLFLQRARQVTPQFEFRPADYAAVARICRLLDGMPLGIELAAGWTAIATSAEIAELVAGNLAALQHTRLDLPARHHSMLAVLDAFWARLSPGEHATLRRLSMIRGTFDETAARTIAGASPFFLGALLVSGYLNRLPDGRYTIHELLRQYARTALRRYPADLRRTELRYAEYYATLTHNAFTATLSGGPALKILHDEHENILAAWQWATEQPRIDLLAAMLPSIARFWDISGQIPFRIALLESTLDRVRTLLNAAPADTVLRGFCVQLLCRLAWFVALAQPARVLAELTDEALLHADQLEDPALRAEVLLTIGIDRYAREPARATAALDEALTLATATPLRAECLRFRGIVAERSEGSAAAMRYYAEALQQFQICGDCLGEIRVQTNLTLLAFWEAEYSRTLHYADQTLSLARTAEVVENQIVALLLKGDALLMMADYTEAEAAFDQALKLALRCGNRNLAVLVQASEAMLLYARGNISAAANYSLKIAQNLPEYVDPHTTLFTYLILGHIARIRHHYDKAEAYYARADESRIRNDTSIGRIDIAAGMAELAFARGDEPDALSRAIALLDAAQQAPLDMYNPYFVLTTCYTILAAQEHPSADQALKQLQQSFIRRVSVIDDPERRRQYEIVIRTEWPLIRTENRELRTEN